MSADREVGVVRGGGERVPGQRGDDDVQVGQLRQHPLVAEDGVGPAVQEDDGGRVVVRGPLGADEAGAGRAGPGSARMRSSWGRQS